MTETLAALLLAHVLADFVFQTGWMVGNKHRAAGLLAHGAVVLAFAIATTGQVTLALWQPGLFGQGLWGGMAPLPALFAALAGAILATRAGGFAIGLLMAPYAAAVPAEGLPGAGRLIGLLERGLIFALVLLGQPEGVGLLMAAKSILRFGAVKDDRALSEYVIIGTLASFGWALLIAYGTVALMAPLGIRPAAP